MKSEPPSPCRTEQKSIDSAIGNNNNNDKDNNGIGSSVGIVTIVQEQVKTTRYLLLTSAAFLAAQ